MIDRTPVIIGVGEASERIDAKSYEALSPADLAGRAARIALEDALSVFALASQIDVVATVRQFETSGPKTVAPFGRADNFPRAVAKRIGANPQRAILEPVGGQGPQHLINEFANAIGAGEARMVLLGARRRSPLSAACCPLARRATGPKPLAANWKIEALGRP